jgi:hypothetical protein
MKPIYVAYLNNCKREVQTRSGDLSLEPRSSASNRGRPSLAAAWKWLRPAHTTDNVVAFTSRTLALWRSPRKPKEQSLIDLQQSVEFAQIVKVVPTPDARLPHPGRSDGTAATLRVRPAHMFISPFIQDGANLP